MLNVIATALLAFCGWIALSIMDLKTGQAVITYKVAENHKMLTTLWEDYLDRNRNDNLAWFDESANIKTGGQVSE